MPLVLTLSAGQSKYLKVMFIFLSESHQLLGSFFWIRPFMRKNLPLWGVVQDLLVTECWFGPLQRKWRSSRGSRDLTHTGSNVAIGEQPSASSLAAPGSPLSPNCHYRRLAVYYVAVSLCSGGQSSSDAAGWLRLSTKSWSYGKIVL